MKDESEPLLGKRTAYQRFRRRLVSLKYLLIPLGVLLWVGAGVLLAMHFEGWTVTTALYVIVQIVTTIGYGDITVHTQAAKLFMSAYVVGTILIIGTLMTDSMDNFVEGNTEYLRKQLRRAQDKIHETQKGVPPPRAPPSEFNRILSSFLLFVFFVGFGTVFYAVYEGCSCSYGVTKIDGCLDHDYYACKATGGAIKTWTDAFYMALITLTTVGFGDHSPKSWEGRIVGCVWMILGVVVTAHFASRFGHLLLAEKRDNHRIERMCPEIFESIDTNKDGTLDRLEFRTYALLKFGLVTQEDLDEIDQLFSTIDQDGSGELTFREITEHCDH